MKGYLAKAECSINRKEKVCEDLDRFYKYKKIPWVEPHYDRVDVLPFVPTTQEVNDLIACLGPKMSVFTLLLKETGYRFNEGYNLRWQDINPANNTANFDADDEYLVKAAKNKIESGYQYVVTTPEGYMLFRKRK